jgi:8-oxo-dGTP pyrophosphatase MutT (NUDIX family)
MKMTEKLFERLLALAAVAVALLGGVFVGFCGGIIDSSDEIQATKTELRCTKIKLFQETCARIEAEEDAREKSEAIRKIWRTR